MNTLVITPSLLQGEVAIPPSKSITHRAIIAAGLSQGVSRLEPVLLSKDILATCRGMEVLGAQIDYGEADQGFGRLTVQGSGGPRAIRNTIHCRESGSTLRFLLPLAALLDTEMIFHGEGRLLQRPLTPYLRIFRDQGLSIDREGEGLLVKGRLSPSTYRLEGDISSQFVTGLLFALPLLEGDSIIRLTSPLESKGYVDLTLEVLDAYSIQVDGSEDGGFYVGGGQTYQAKDYTIEGDYSQAAFWLAAGLLGAPIRCTRLRRDSKQGDAVILGILRRMGGIIVLDSQGMVAYPSTTRGVDVDVSQCPDLVPILAVLAALSQGRTRILRAKRLRLKESDRLRATARELNRMGAKVEEREDGLLIEGVDHLRGGEVDSWKDHRIAMALAIASIKCTSPVILRNSDAVDTSYPGFWRDFVKLGGRIHERNLG